jgi:D-threo-aldose 1-dehydrogenase
VELTLPRVGLGTAPIGGLYAPVGDDAAHATVDRAWDGGVRFFDTAPFYGLGRSEERLGRALADRPRDEFVLATKVGRLLRAGAPRDRDRELWKEPAALEPVFDFSGEATLRSVAESLERLGLDRIDVLHVHDAQDHVDEALRGAYPALAELRADGTIAAVGAGMNYVEPLIRLAHEADFDCFLVAGRYTLLDQTALPELLPLCLGRGIRVIVGGVYNSGILADPSPGATFDYAPAPRGRLEQARRLAAACARHGVPLIAAALQFPLAHPAVASVLVGARSPAEVDASLDALALPIPGELWGELRRDGLLPEEAPVP